jgi:hypothetical protein
MNIIIPFAEAALAGAENAMPPTPTVWGLLESAAIDSLSNEPSRRTPVQAKIRGRCAELSTLAFVRVQAPCSWRRPSRLAAARRASPPIARARYQGVLIDPTIDARKLHIDSLWLRPRLTTAQQLSSMHKLLLYGQVPAARHDQVLKILAGVAAMQPQRILERRIIYRPEREPEEPGSNLRRGGTQAVVVKQTKPQSTAATTLYYTHLVQKLTDADFGTTKGAEGATLSADVDFEGGEEPVWSVLFEDIPDTGDRGVSIRFSNSTDLLGGDPHAHMLAAGPNR